MEYDTLIKVIIVGDSGVGKSSIMTRYCDKFFTNSYISTIGVDFKIRKIVIGNTKCKLQIWDTAGQERFKSITTSYYRGADCILVVYDVFSYKSFDYLKNHQKDSHTYCDKNVITAVIGNKTDNSGEREVTRTEGSEYAESIHALFFETSAKSGKNIDNIFETISSEHIKKNIGLPEITRNKNKIYDDKSSTKNKCCQ